MVNELHCAICSNLYQTAFVLPCGDCACANCLVSSLELEITEPNVSLIDRFGDKDFNDVIKRTCPICHHTVILPSIGIFGLPRYKIIDPIIESLHENNTNDVQCDFCEDYEKQKATLKCVECNFNYCGSCFDSVHVNRGPLAGHQIIPAYQTRDISYDVCTTHNPEKKKLFCFDCRLCVCFLCKEVGSHQQHKTELASTLFEQEKVKMNEQSNDLDNRDKNILEAILKSEDFSVYVKKVGLETESHVIRECDDLINTIQRKKERFLKQISNEYDELLETITLDVNNLNEDHRTLGSLDEIITTATSTDDVVGVLESLAPVNKKISKAKKESKEHISHARSNTKIVPFKGLVLDVVQLKKEIQALSWLKQPGPPIFITSKCKAKNNQIFLSWQPQRELADSYDLMKNDKLVYRGKESSNICVEADYNKTYSFRVSAENAAGKGEAGNDLVISTPRGVSFSVDVNKSHEEIKVSRDHLSIRSNATEEMQTAFADVCLSRGVHFWKTRIEKVSEKNSSKGYISVGICGFEDDGDNNDYENHDFSSTQYAVMVMLKSRSPPKQNNENIIQINRTTTEIVEQDISCKLDSHQGLFDVYINGVLIKRDVYSDHTFQGLKSCTFTPFLRFKHVSTQVTFINNLITPTVQPNKPEFDSTKCFSKNTNILFHWIKESTSIDAYILEIFHDLETDNGRLVYQGNKSKFLYEASNYNETVFARLYAINIAGLSEFSDILCMKTAKGIDFSFNDNNNPALQLWSSNRSVKYSSPEPIILYSDFEFTSGIHFWKLAIEQYDGKHTKLGIGLATKNITSDLFGVQDSYVINITSSKPIETPMYTINVIKKKKAILQSEFAFLVDQGKRRFYGYDNGMLITSTTDEILNIPRSLWTFSNVKSSLHPTVMIEGNIKFSVFCNQLMPQKPAPPIFGKCYCENISCHYTWFPSQESGSYTNYCVLKISIASGFKENNKKTNEVFKEAFRGPSTTFTLKQLPYNSKITAFLTAINTVGESDDSERIVLFTAKGFFFEFDKKSKSPPLVLLNQNQTVQLSSPVHSYVLGDKVMAKGFHSWKIIIDEFGEQNEMSVVGIGVSQSKLNDPILGEDQTSYAVQIIEHPKVNIRQTKHRHQIQLSSNKAVKTVVVVELNLDEHWMNIFVNGSQLRPNVHAVGQPTFQNVQGEYYPAVSLYGSRIKLSIENVND